MKAISVLMQKGGSGKTTLVQSLAVAAKNGGMSVAVIDLDPQATACKWGDRRNADPVIISIQASRLAHALKTAKDGAADLVIIDTPPRAADAAMAAALVADLILIPCRATINDLETIATTQSLIQGAAAKAQVFVVLNDIPPIGQQRRQAEDAIRDMRLAVCPVALGHRAAYPHAAALGLTAQEYAPGGKAAGEIQQLYGFVCKLISLSTIKRDKEYANAASKKARSA